MTLPFPVAYRPRLVQVTDKVTIPPPATVLCVNAATSSRMGPVRVLWSIVRSFFEQVFVHPVRSGGPRPLDWERSTRVLTGWALLVFIALLGGALFADQLDAGKGLDVFFAMPVVPRVLATVAITTVFHLLFAASTRSPVWAHGLIVLGTIVMIAAGTSGWFAVANAIPHWGPLLFLVLFAPLQLICAVAAIILSIWHRRRPGAESWPIISALPLGVGYGLPMLIGSFTSPNPVLVTSIALGLMILLLAAIPLGTAAGVAFAEITSRASHAAVIAVRPHLPSRVWPWVTAVLAALAITVTALPLRQFSWRGTNVFTVVGPVLEVAFMLLVTALARRRGPADTTTPVVLAEELGPMVLAVAATGPWWVVTVPLIGDSGNAVRWWSLLGVAVAAWLAWRGVRRGSVAQALVGAALICGQLRITTQIGLQAWQRDVVTQALLIAALAVAALVWRRRGPLIEGQWVSLSIGLLLLILFPFRQTIAEPLEALAGDGSGALVVGLTWCALTDGTFTRKESRQLPQTPRVLIFAAYVVVAALGAMMSQLMADQNEIFDLQTYNAQGDFGLGRCVLLMMIAGLIEAGRFRVDPDPLAPPPPVEWDQSSRPSS